MNGAAASWPSAVDYTAAVQDPEVCLVDERLKRAEFALNRFDMPVVRSGQTAAVFPVTIDGTKAALRLFTVPTDHAERYRMLNDHLVSHPDAPLVPASWIDEAVAVGVARYPGVLMPWVGGSMLSSVIEDAVEEGRVTDLRPVAERWLELVRRLGCESVVHGDLQHGNVLVEGDQRLNLIDYDGVWVPGMQTHLAEIGHPNYQHPQRAEFHEVLAGTDSFAAFVIYVSLLAVIADPAVWGELHNGENLLFVERDYVESGRRGARVWEALATSPDPTVIRHAGTLAELCCTDIRSIPTVDALVAGGVGALDGAARYVPERAGQAIGGNWWGEEEPQAAPDPATQAAPVPPMSILGPVADPAVYAAVDGGGKPRGSAQYVAIALILLAVLVTVVAVALLFGR